MTHTQKQNIGYIGGIASLAAPIIACGLFLTPPPAHAGDLSSQFNTRNGVEQLCNSNPAVILRPTTPTHKKRIVHDGIVYDAWVGSSGKCMNPPRPLGRIGVQHTFLVDGYSPRTRLFRIENGNLAEYVQFSGGTIERLEFASQCGNVKTYSPNPGHLPGWPGPSYIPTQNPCF